ncbi:c-type cytochrome [Taklimakanibacter lacteus]|uniref:c-type cytochrome n=1 Tax=Taklimakanibacter lacteus TaxID=2268456 RepID=UPI0013C4BFF2
MSYPAHISAIGLLLLLALASGHGVGKAEPSGETDFRISCSACHGEDGRGGGGKVFGLSVEPPDLTTLRIRNGGVFQRERLRRIIDGREDIKLHGDREMPVWGQLFKVDAEEGLGGAEGDEATVRRRIEALIDFIESFQR